MPTLTITSPAIVGASLVFTSETGVRYKQSAIPSREFATHSSEHDFSGTIDYILYSGYNIAPGGTTKVDQAEPSLWWGVESHYNRTSDGSQLIEWNMDYRSADGLFEARWMAFNANRLTHQGAWAFACADFSLLSNDGESQWAQFLSTGNAFHRLSLARVDSQTQNILETRIESGTVLSGIDKDGYFFGNRIYSPNASDVTLALANGSTGLQLYDPSADTDEKRWRVEFGSGSFKLTCRNDAESGTLTWFRVDRTGTAIGDYIFQQGGKIVLGATAGLSVGGIGFQACGNSPVVVLRNTSAEADNEIWTALETDATHLFGRALSDNLGNSEKWFEVTRSGATIVSVDFPNGAVKIGGAGSTVGFYAANPVALQTGVEVSAAGIHAALVNLGLIAA